MEVGARTIAACHLLNLAYWHRRSLKWDPAAWSFVNDAQANGWMDYQRREGYELAVGKPEVIYKEVNGKRFEPVEGSALEIRNSQAARQETVKLLLIFVRSDDQGASKFGGLGGGEPRGRGFAEERPRLAKDEQEDEEKTSCSKSYQTPH